MQVGLSQRRLEFSEEIVWKKQNHLYFILKVVLLISPSYSDSSAGKESTCNAGDPGSIPGLGRSPGEGIGYPLQYSWASLVAQLVKNPPAMQETLVQFLGWEDPLEKGWATHSSVLRLPLMPQMVKNLPAIWETWVLSLGWEYPLKKGKAPHSSILA